MASSIFNSDEFRHPADGWYQIEAAGVHPNRASNVIQRIDATAGKSITDNYNADAAAGKLRHGHEMLIDHEHFSDMPDQETRAYGWLQKLQNRDDGIYGKIRWTTTGKAAVDGGDYRFFSTEYDPKDLQVLNSGQPREVRPLRLAGLTLTNMNNNRGQKAITNREKPRGFQGTQQEYDAKCAENARHVQANKDAADKVAAQRKADSEGEAAEFALPDLEKFYRAVKSVIEASAKTGHQMPFASAWTYAQGKWPDLFAAAFPDSASVDDPASAAKEVSTVANRIALLSGKDFSYGFNFVREEMPRLFNRMNRAPGMVLNRSADTARRFSAASASKVFNRLVQAEAAVFRLPENAAFKAVANRHPGLFGLATGRLLPSEATNAEANLSALLP